MEVLLFIQRWWRSIDCWVLFAVVFLFALGFLLSLTYTHALTQKLSMEQQTFFVYRHLFYLISSIILMVTLSGIPQAILNKANLIVAIVTFFLMVCTLMYASPLKGGQRWLRIFDISIQPSEMMRATFPLITAQILTRFFSQRMQIISSATPLLIIMSVLLAQPDIGMVFLMCVTYAAQLFIAIKELWLVVCVIAFPVICITLALSFSTHARARLQAFFDINDMHGGYQVSLSTKSFQSGGFLGVGPGEGTIKQNLPDMHSDFIFATIGEELGTLFCILILFLYLFIVCRTLHSSLLAKNIYIILVSTGCAMYIIAQTIVNTASVLGIIPPKGTTLPFISYGGSSLLSSAWLLGILLNVSRKHVRTQSHS